MTRSSCGWLLGLSLLGNAFISIAQQSDSPAKAAPKSESAAPPNQRAGKSAPAWVPTLPSSPIFKATAAEMDEAMRADTAANQKEPLQFPKGKGVRMLMTGHSWVAPGRKTLPEIAKAGGYEGHHQRAHTSGGSTGSANSIWLTEFGQFKGKPKTPILLPAIATGQWDVMTWGAYFGDVPEHYTQWMEVCLKHNPKMIFYIQDGWPIFRGELKDASAKDALAALDDQHQLMQEGLFKSLYDPLEAKHAGKVRIIPAGAAVVTMLKHYYAKELPGFDCVSEHLGGTKGIYRDGGHLSAGSGMEQLVGYMYYGMIYKKSPALLKDYRPANIDAKVDQLMRAAAWKAITSSPFSGVVDANNDGVGEAKAK